MANVIIAIEVALIKAIEKHSDRVLLKETVYDYRDNPEVLDEFIKKF